MTRPCVTLRNRVRVPHSNRRHNETHQELVVGILLRKLLEPEQQNGALLDGFPRTEVQKRVPQAALEGGEGFSEAIPGAGGEVFVASP